MINKTIALVSLLLLVKISRSQEVKPHEEFAVSCIENRLSKLNLNRTYIFESIEEVQQLATNNDTTSYNKKINELDSVLTICGFFKDNHLDISTLSSCLEEGCKLDRNIKYKKSKYYSLLKFLKEWEESPELFQQVSPTLILGTLKSTIPIKKVDEDIYRLSSFIVLQGVMKEMRNFVESKKKNTDSFYSNGTDETIVPINLIKKQTQDTIFTIVEKMPLFNGAIDQEESTKLLYKYVEQKVKEDEFDIKGIIYVSFVVNKKGETEKIKVLRGINSVVDNKAIKYVEGMPVWVPGEQKGKKVKVQYTIPIRIKY